MKKIHIFKTGKHTSANGETSDFSEDLLQAAVAGYDPELHEAPIVIGHPKTNNPAYGWIKSLTLKDGQIDAVPYQVNADFEEMVKAGSFKKISASWYLPDSPTNPKQGTLYLRHVGFLGAQPPAIKGLNDVEFNEAEEGVIEFEELWDDAWSLQNIGDVFKRVREFIIDKFSVDEADKVIPDYIIDDLQNQAKNKFNKVEDSVAPINSNFNEDNTMTLEELEAKVTQLEAEKTALTTEKTTLETKVTNFEEQQATAAKGAMIAKIDALIAEGKALPAQRSQLIAFAESLSVSGQVVEFGEGDNKQQLSGVDALVKFVQSTGTKVDFDEQSHDQDQESKPMNSRELAAKAVEYQEDQRKAGRTIDIAMAVNEIQAKAE